MGANGEEDRLVALGRQFVDRLHLHPGANLHALGHDVVDLLLQHIAGQTIGGHAHAHHATGDWQRLEDRHGITQPNQVLGGREARGAGADDGDRLVVFPLRELGRLLRCAVGQRPIGDEALGRHRRYRLVQQPAVAFFLAEGIADAPANAREGQAILDQAVGVGVALLF